MIDGIGRGEAYLCPSLVAVDNRDRHALRVPFLHRALYILLKGRCRERQPVLGGFIIVMTKWLLWWNLRSGYGTTHQCRDEEGTD